MMRLLAAFAAWWHRLAGALIGDLPHPYAGSYPGPGGCWCGHGEDCAVHGERER